MGALPFCRATLVGIRCPKGPYFIQAKSYPANPRTIGDAIRKRRLDLGLRQIDVAAAIGCNELSVLNWEKSYTSPRIDQMAKIIKFLGYNPLSKGTTIAERIAHHRQTFGMTQKQFARKIGIDPTTLARWERGERCPRGKFLETLQFGNGGWIWD